MFATFEARRRGESTPVSPGVSGGTSIPASPCLDSTIVESLLASAVLKLDLLLNPSRTADPTPQAEAVKVSPERATVSAADARTSSSSAGSIHASNFSTTQAFGMHAASIYLVGGTMQRLAPKLVNPLIVDWRSTDCTNISNLKDGWY